MIRSVVNDRAEIRITLPVFDAAGFEQVIDAVLDTGFDGWLGLPNALISSLQLSRVAELPARFGDGRVELIDHYEAKVRWDGVERLIDVHALDGDILIGMAPALRPRPAGAGGSRRRCRDRGDPVAHR